MAKFCRSYPWIGSARSLSRVSRRRRPCRPAKAARVVAGSIRPDGQRRADREGEEDGRPLAALLGAAQPPHRPRAATSGQSATATQPRVFARCAGSSCGSTTAEKRRCRRTLAATMVAARQPRNHGSPAPTSRCTIQAGHDHHPVDRRRGGLVEPPPPQWRPPAGRRIAQAAATRPAAARRRRASMRQRRPRHAGNASMAATHVARRRVPIVGPLPGAALHDDGRCRAAAAATPDDATPSAASTRAIVAAERRRLERVDARRPVRR